MPIKSTRYYDTGMWSRPTRPLGRLYVIMVQLIVLDIVQEGTILMLAVNYSTIRNNLKQYCDTVTDDLETIIVTRKDSKNVVLISLEEYNALVKAAKNAEYLSMLDRSMAQLDSGETVTRTMEELERME